MCIYLFLFISLCAHTHTHTHTHSHTHTHAHTHTHSQVMWEYFDDGGLWQSCAEEDSYKIEAHFFEFSQQFHLGDYHYHLNHMTRSHPQTRNSQRIKRTMFVQERREGEGGREGERAGGMGEG